MKAFLNYIELWLSAAGVGIIMLVSALVGGSSPGDQWRITAYTAVAIGVVHGIIFWAVRHRQRRARYETLREAHAMLRDGIHKQVAALLTMDATASEEQRRRLDGVFDSLMLLDHLLDALDAERLRAWTASEEGRMEMARSAPARPGGAPVLHVSRDSYN